MLVENGTFHVIIVEKKKLSSTVLHQRTFHFKHCEIADFFFVTLAEECVGLVVFFSFVSENN